MRLGIHTTEFANAFVNREPRAATASRLGVRTHPPTHPSASARNWSVKIKRIFGLIQPPDRYRNPIVNLLDPRCGADRALDLMQKLHSSSATIDGLMRLVKLPEAFCDRATPIARLSATQPQLSHNNAAILPRSGSEDWSGHEIGLRRSTA